MILYAIRHAFLRLHPWALRKNPVILATYISALVSTFFCFQPSGDFVFECQISLWLWLTVIFANFAEALAEGRGKAHAESLRKSSESAMAWKKMGAHEVSVPALSLKKGDLIVCRAQDMIPVDGEVVAGIASVDESAITGESAPVIRESGGDRSAVTGGTTVLSDEIVIQVTAAPGQGFMDRMIGLIESAVRQKTPNEKALEVLLIALTLLFILVVISLPVVVGFSGAHSILSIPVLLALFVCLIPTTIGGLLSAVGIAGMDRLIRKNVVAKNGRAVEAAGDITVLLLDKTGTITLGNRLAVAFHPVSTATEEELAIAAHTASLSDETPEGRSIVVLAKNKFGMRLPHEDPKQTTFIPFSAKTRMSGVDLVKDQKNITIRKGAVDAVKLWVQEQGAFMPQEALDVTHCIATAGGTPLAVCVDNRVLGIVELKDVVKGGIKERFFQLRKMGIKTIMITGDNPATAAAIAAEAGVDDFIAQATPEDKLNRIRLEQAQGYLVAMTGDGTNDAPALAQADVGVAMNLGTQAARDAGNMVDLDSNPTKLIEIVETGKQLLMTRGALTTFSIANDVAKYFAILPALFVGVYAQSGKLGPLSVLNVMHLHSTHSAILSAVIFNALIVIALIPLALRGVTYKPQTAGTLLVKNLLIYGVGGIGVPFMGIKLIDVCIVALNWV